MRSYLCYAAIALSITSSNATALTATLLGPGNVAVYNVPAAGAVFDLSVNMSRGGGDPGITGIQMDFTADIPGASLQCSGIISAPPRCFQYNAPEWNSETAGGGPTNLGSMPPVRGTFGSNYGSFTWTTSNSLMGWIGISVGATSTPRDIHIVPVNVTGFDENFIDFPGQGAAVTLHQLPEPAGILLLLAALPLLRRRHLKS